MATKPTRLDSATVIVIDDSDEESAADTKPFCDDSMNDSRLIAAAEEVETSSPYMRSIANSAKRIHMDIKDCRDHSETESGAKALTNPSIVAKSSKDPNRGLHPRPSRKKNLGFSDAFVPASSLHDVNLPSTSAPRFMTGVNTASHPQKFESCPRRQARQGRNKLCLQSNSLDRYFSSSQPIKRSSDQSAGVSERLDRQPSSSQGSAVPLLPRSSTLMYSPIKQVKGTNIYMCAQDEGDDTNGKTDVSKGLFQPKKPQTRPRRSNRAGKSSKKTEPTFNRNNLFLYSKESSGKNVSTAPASENMDLYGLLGNGNKLPEESTYVTQISDLPYEILENILCRLPLMDLCLNVNMVCKDWMKIISNKKFVPWKKLYHRVKVGEFSAVRYVQDLKEKHGMTSKESFLIQLVRFMTDFKPVTARDMTDCLKAHPMYVAARGVMNDRLQECIHNDTPNPWSMITLLVILSEFVRDVSGIFDVLLSSPSSQCRAYELTECFYAIATFLFMFRKHKYADVWNCMHYRLFYALYLFENESCTTAAHLSSAHQHNRCGQQTITKYSLGDSSMQMTHEQQRICNHNVGQNETIKIVAFAGTGKTTTLVRYTQLRPSLKFLLLVFNRSAKDYAQTKFPRNVTCMTGHGLAHKHVGRKYAAAKKLGSNVRVTDVVDVMKARKGESLYVQAKHIVTTINSFMSSADDFITTAHTPRETMDEKSGRKKSISHDMQMHYAEQAEKVWKRLVDLDDKRMKLPHDGYLKLYQLEKRPIYNYDVLLIDEAQDTTPAVADIIQRQSMPKIMVGDPHQQIYSFRGAVNAMKDMQASHVFYLTQSFRFGPEIAQVASCCLEFLKGEFKKTLVGNGKPGSVRGEEQGQVAVISRSNFQVFTEAVKHCCFSDKNIKVGFVGGVDSFGFDMILDIYTLMLPPEERTKERRQIQNYFIGKFGNLIELEKYANKTMDNELLGKIKIVKTYNTAIPGHISKIRAKCVRDNDAADILFSTAHKSKGLEFSTVRLTDDFTAPLPCDTLTVTAEQKSQLQDESNLLYVAVTRAKRCLQITPTVYRLLRYCGQTFRYPVESSRLQAEGVPMRCSETDADFQPLPCTVVRRKIIMSNGEEKAQQVYSPAWVREDLLSLRALFGDAKPPAASDEQRHQNMDVDDGEEENEWWHGGFLDAPYQVFPYVL